MPPLGGSSPGYGQIPCNDGCLHHQNAVLITPHLLLVYADFHIGSAHIFSRVRGYPAVNRLYFSLVSFTDRLIDRIRSFLHIQAPPGSVALFPNREFHRRSSENVFLTDDTAVASQFLNPVPGRLPGNSRDFRHRHQEPIRSGRHAPMPPAHLRSPASA